jgi:hypothetical protein
LFWPSATSRYGRSFLAVHESLPETRDEIPKKSARDLAGCYAKNVAAADFAVEASVASHKPSRRRLSRLVFGGKARCMDRALVLSDEVSTRVEELLIISTVEAIAVDADRI